MSGPRTLGDAMAHLVEQFRDASGELVAVDAVLAEDGVTAIVMCDTRAGATITSCFDVPPGTRFRPREVEQRIELALHFGRALA